MSETDKTEKIERKKISSSGPEQAAPAKPRGAAEADAKADHAPSRKSSTAASPPVQKSPAGAKAAAPAAAKAAVPKAGGTLRIRQIKSGICAPVDQKQTLSGLGLRRIRHEVVRPDTPAVRGQIRKVRHLVEIVEGGAAR